jgi:hypothetical protein
MDNNNNPWFIEGASGTDTLSLGDARAAVHFESGAKSWEDVITFG